jgi:drug/metabolite transporter (DMT)-like permease
MIGSIVLYVIQDSIVKSLPNEMSTVQVIFFRSLFSFIPIFIFAHFEKQKAKPLLHLLKTAFLKGHIIRALTMFCSLGCYLNACRYIPLADVYTLSYTSPLFMTLLAIPLLKEKASIRRCLAVAVGFLGVIIVLRPSGDCFQWAGFSAVFSGFFVAISAIWGRKLTFSDSNTLIVVMYAMVGLVISALILPFVWVTPNVDTLFMLLMIGITGGVAQYGFTHAYRLTPISIIAPFDYSGLIFAIPVGYWLWGDLPDIFSFMGMMIIIAAGLYTLVRESEAHRKEGLKAIYSEALTNPEAS